MSSSDKILVAAIDIGTTQSGWAFSTAVQYSADPFLISAFCWLNPETRLISTKTPTCILFNKDKVFDSFGYEAENKYSELAEEEEHQEWYFFKNFKTTLLNKKEQLSKEVTIYTADGREMMAFDVFSAAIKFLRDHLLEHLEERALGRVSWTDIQWVITVPAIWDDAAKQFMREAAEKADICGEQLLIVTEPEAVFLYYMHKETRDGRKHCSSMGTGTKCMVVIAEDVGFEIGVYDVHHKRILRKLFSALNFDWGENKVDASWFTLVSDIVGDNVMKAFITKHEFDFLLFLNDLQFTKRAIRPEETGKVTISTPASLLETYLEMNPECNINTRISSLPKYKNKLIWKAGRIRIDAQLAKSIFHESCSKIVYHLQELFLYPTLRDVSSILLAGSYAELPMLQSALTEAFKSPHREVFTPDKFAIPGLCGAVMYGHRPKIYS